MGREVKRVALDFEWPLNKVWWGYECPHANVTCHDCGGTGYAPHGKFLKGVAHIISIGGSHPKGHPYLRQWELPAPGEEFTKFSGALSRPPHHLLGHDSLDVYRIFQRLVQAAGLPEDWGTCTGCDGHGITKEAYRLQEEWEPTPPPAGEGWQLWETVSEGSPVSPVFGTPEALAQWLADNKASSFGSQAESYETWLKFIQGTGMGAVGDVEPSGRDGKWRSCDVQKKR